MSTTINEKLLEKDLKGFKIIKVFQLASIPEQLVNRCFYGYFKKRSDAQTELKKKGHSHLEITPVMVITNGTLTFLISIKPKKIKLI